MLKFSSQHGLSGNPSPDIISSLLPHHPPVSLFRSHALPAPPPLPHFPLNYPILLVLFAFLLLLLKVFSTNAEWLFEVYLIHCTGLYCTIFSYILFSFMIC